MVSISKDYIQLLLIPIEAFSKMVGSKRRVYWITIDLYYIAISTFGAMGDSAFEVCFISWNLDAFDY
jgi:hypothetical protein